jgi:hypothetical protein
MVKNKYFISDLDSAREFLRSYSGKVVLTNPPGSTRYYGVLVLNYMFQKLLEEFPDKIEAIEVNGYDDKVAADYSMRR